MYGPSRRDPKGRAVHIDCFEFLLLDHTHGVVNSDQAGFLRIIFSSK